MDPKEIRAMIVEDLDLQGVPPDMQDKIIDQFTENALKRITIAVYERMPEEGRAEFAQIGEKGDAAAMLQLFQKHIPDLDAFVRAELQDELRRYKGSANAA